MAMKDISTHPWRARWRACTLAAAVLVPALAAHAQLRLPQVGVPALPTGPLGSLTQTLQQAVPLQELRAATGRELIRRYPNAIDTDPSGEPIRRDELVWVSPSAAALTSALAEGFAVLREEDLPELELRQVVMRPPSRLNISQSAQRLRALDPQAAVDFNHLYTRSGEAAAGTAAGAPAPSNSAPFRVGLIDGGVDRVHPALRRATIRPWGCDGKDVASDHGTAVASLLVGRDRAFRGVHPAATLYAADVYCEQPAGGAAEEVVRAMAWMARERVAVINISLVGPANRVMERATASLVKQGFLVVAAVGNDGPAAPPLYPASYPGVVGVTGVTGARRVLPEAAQGPQVMFAAPGVALAVAQPGSGYTAARGTSFAAPFVAGLLAQSMREPGPEGAQAAIAKLALAAIDLGEPGRDAVYGFGLVGESARISPERMQAQR